MFEWELVARGALLLGCMVTLIGTFGYAFSESGCPECHNTKKIDAFSGTEWFKMTCPHCKDAE